MAFGSRGDDAQHGSGNQQDDCAERVMHFRTDWHGGSQSILETAGGACAALHTKKRAIFRGQPARRWRTWGGRPIPRWPMTRANRCPPRILVVEDEDPIRQLVDRILRETGYETSAAPNGLEGLRLIETEASFDLLLTDLDMPQMSGDELVRRARVLHPDLKVMYLTGFSDRLFTDRSMLWEDEAFLDKPITLNGLREAVSLALFGHVRGPDREDPRLQTGR
jgi:CheY-like chemotaxis protein